jgi:hypothetical protein
MNDLYHTDPAAIYLVDERQIVTVHDAAIVNDPNLRDHLSMINASLTLLADLPVFYVDDHPDQVTRLRLAIRCFNSGAAGLSLAKQGYFQPALTMIRDLIEVYFLLDLFGREPRRIAEWRTMDKRDREKSFKPVKVRERLDELDGYKDQRRAAAYRLFSEHGAHVTPNGFQLISPDNLTQVGPFPDSGRLRAILEELVQHISYAAIVFCNQIESDDAQVLAVKGPFVKALSGWKSRHFGS